MHHLQHVRSLLYFSSHSIPSDCMRVVNYDEGDEYCNQPIDSIEYIYIYILVLVRTGGETRMSELLL